MNARNEQGANNHKARESARYECYHKERGKPSPFAEDASCGLHTEGHLVVLGSSQFRGTGQEQRSLIVVKSRAPSLLFFESHCVSLAILFNSTQIARRRS